MAAAGRAARGTRCFAEPPGGWSLPAPPEPAAARRCEPAAVGAARLPPARPLPAPQRGAHAQARRRQVRAPVPRRAASSAGVGSACSGRRGAPLAKRLPEPAPALSPEPASAGELCRLCAAGLGCAAAAAAAGGVRAAGRSSPVESLRRRPAPRALSSVAAEKFPAGRGSPLCGSAAPAGVSVETAELWWPCPRPSAPPPAGAERCWAERSRRPLPPSSRSSPLAAAALAVRVG